MKISKLNSISIIIMPVAVLLLIFPALAQEQINLNLGNAIDMVLQNNESYQIAQKEVDRANARIIEALATGLPQFTANLQYLRNWEIPSQVVNFNGEDQTFKFGTTNNYTAALTVTQPIYNGGRTFTALKIAGTARKLVHESLHSTREELKEQTYNAFYGALLAQEVLRVNQESQKLALDNLDQVSKMYDQGMAAEFDYLRAKVAVANLDPAVIKAQNDAELAMSALKNLIGLNLQTQITLQADTDSTQFILPPIDEEAAKAELQEKRPEILISDYNTKISKQLISIATADYRPWLFFSTSLQYQRFYETGGIFATHWNRSIFSALALSIPIFDSWKTPTVVKQAKIDYTQNQLKEEAVKKGMVLDFQQSLGKYNEARKRLSVQGDAIDLARRGLKIATVRYESGVGTQLEVADARLSLSMAEINRAVAFHDLAVSYAALMRALGRDINIGN